MTTGPNVPDRPCSAVRQDGRDRRWFWLGIAVLQLAFLGHQLVQRRFHIGDAKTKTGDSYEYLWQAQNIRHAGSFYSGDPGAPIVPELYTRRPPLYPLLIAAIATVW